MLMRLCWDKDKKQARNKQVCIGKIDAGTGDFIPSKRLTPEQAAVRDSAVTASAEIVGPAIVLDIITEQLGLEKLLKSCFPQYHQQILTMAYYLITRGGHLSHCEKWSQNHAHPLRAQLTGQRISEILRSITIDGKQSFLTKWMAKVMEDDYLCYDITSVSSYSELNEYIKYGHNRDGEMLPQLNLAMLFGQKSCLPVYFQRMPGNITDVTTLYNLLRQVVGHVGSSYGLRKNRLYGVRGLKLRRLAGRTHTGCRSISDSHCRAFLIRCCTYCRI